MKINDVYYHPDEQFIQLIPESSRWDNGYTRISDGYTSGFDNRSLFKEKLIFIANTPTPNLAELRQTYPEYFI